MNILSQIGLQDHGFSQKSFENFNKKIDSNFISQATNDQITIRDQPTMKNQVASVSHLRSSVPDYEEDEEVESLIRSKNGVKVDRRPKRPRNYVEDGLARSSIRQ